MAVGACQEELPTALDGGPLPEEPLTVEVQLPWSAFGSDFQVLGGYGTAGGLAPVLARTYEGTLDARVLLRFGAFPTSVRVVDASGATVTDTSFTYVGGHLILGFDTLASVTSGPVDIEIGALQEEWDARTASWTLAVDTVADQRAWTEVGAGPAPLIGSGAWDPSFSDSVSFALDSSAVADWVDVTDQSRGARIAATTDGVRLRLSRALLRVNIRPTLDPDTLVVDTVPLIGGTFVYDPPPLAPVGMRVGGVPAWRSLMSVSLPQLTGPPELCAAVGCPYTPQSGHISYAGLSLTSQAPELAFQADRHSAPRRPLRAQPRDPPEVPSGRFSDGWLGPGDLARGFRGVGGVLGGGSDHRVRAYPLGWTRCKWQPTAGHPGSPGRIGAGVATIRGFRRAR